MSSCVSLCLCLCLFVFVFVGVGPVYIYHVEGGFTAGFLLPTPRLINLDVPLTEGVCDYAKLGAPKSTLYYGRNQVVVRLGEGYTENSFRQIKLYGYVNSNSVNTSTSFSAGPYNGISWSYDESSARVLSTVYNGTTPPPNFPQQQNKWDQVWDIEIPQGYTCTPHCTLQLIGKTVSASGVSLSAVSCADVVLQEVRPTSVYLTLRPDGCCPLEPVSISRRFYEMFGSSTSINPFAASAYPVWNYQTDMSIIISNVWYIDQTARNTFNINPQTGYYSVKIIIHDQYNQTAQQFIQTLTNTQLVSSALSPDSRGANNSYVWWGDAPNTYLPGGNPVAGGANGKSINAASSSSSYNDISISIVATALIAVIVENAAYI